MLDELNSSTLVWGLRVGVVIGVNHGERYIGTGASFCRLVQPMRENASGSDTENAEIEPP